MAFMPGSPGAWISGYPASAEVPAEIPVATPPNVGVRAFEAGLTQGIIRKLTSSSPSSL
jgi:hypothetical protein